MADYIIKPCAKVSGILMVSGDKSISHRLAMLCGLADGESVIGNFLMSEDCLNTLRAVEKLGAGVEISSSDGGSEIKINGTGGTFVKPAETLDMGNSGTGMRLMCGLLAGQPFFSRMTGDVSLCSRPMGRIQSPLKLMDAHIDLMGDGGCAPIEIHGRRLNGIKYELPVASAQVKSCVLLAGLQANGETVVIEPRATRDHTERLLSAMGADLSVDGHKVTIRPGGALSAGVWAVPGDFSSAAFWICAAACMPGSELTVKGVGLNPRRTAMLDVLKRMGADVKVSKFDGTWEESGNVSVKGSALIGTEVFGDEIPNLIDELPLVAVLGALSSGETVIRDAAELRVKESDRISSVVAGLKSFGVDAEEHPDGMVIRGGSKIVGGCEVDSKGDHRIAMSMAILGLFADSPVKVHDVACVDTSYPGFYEHLQKVVS